MKKLIQLIVGLLQKKTGRGPSPHPDRNARLHAFALVFAALFALACADPDRDHEERAEDEAQIAEDGGAPIEASDGSVNEAQVHDPLLPKLVDERRLFGRVAPVPLPEPQPHVPPLVGPGPK